MITKEEWVDWKSNSVTQVFLRLIHEKREALKEGIAQGAAGNDLQLVIGRCMSLDDILQEAKYNFLEGETFDN